MDAERDAWLRSQGFGVLRFSNNRIDAWPQQVLDEIRASLGREPILSGPLERSGVCRGKSPVSEKPLIRRAFARLDPAGGEGRWV